MRFILREQPPVAVPDEAKLFAIIRASFQMRRKQLMNTLGETLGADKERVARICRQAGIAPERRGETLNLDDFARLARAAADHHA